MLFEKIKSKGLAHYSYLVGDKNEAVVIDPRRDNDIFLQKTKEEGVTIKHVLETHRNEDYMVGSREVKKATGAKIWHADSDLNYQYANPVKEGQTWQVGDLIIEALHTPGHTPGSFSYILYGYAGNPWMVFTGDALFAGDVGRVDLLGKEHLKEQAGQLYQSIFDKILPLGEEVILCPAHGAGSVCGSEIAERDWTTIGLEKKLNPKLQAENKEEFIQNTAVMLERPPYFRKMEEYNLNGPPLLSESVIPPALSPGEFSSKVEQEDTMVVDTRMEVSFASAHIKGALSIWKEGLSAFAGWFIPYDKEIILVTEGDFPYDEIKYLRRLGFDNIGGYLAGGMLKWHMAGKNSESIETVTVDQLCHIIDHKEDYWILDVRPWKEIEEEGEIPEAVNIHLTQVPDNLSEIPEDKQVYVFCGSGLRSMIVASILSREGYSGMKVVLGGLAGWSSITCPIE